MSQAWHQACCVGLIVPGTAAPTGLWDLVRFQALQMDLLRCPVSEKGESPRFFPGLMLGRLRVMDFLRLLGTSLRLRLHVWFGGEQHAS